MIDSAVDRILGYLCPRYGTRQVALRVFHDLDSGVDELRMTYGTIAEKSDEIAIVTRSILEIIFEFSHGIEMPPRHVEKARAPASPKFEGPWTPPLVRIHVGEQASEDAFVAIQYRDFWCWIDDRDIIESGMTRK